MKNIFYASECGAKMNSNVYTGGGDDDTAAIQAILDKAPELGYLHLIVDGAALVSGLLVHSNTTIECLNPSCGFFLKKDAKQPLLAVIDGDLENRKAKNISLLGGTYNGNNMEQPKQIEDEDIPTLKVLSTPCEDLSEVARMAIIIELVGVENVLIRDVVLKDQRRWAFLCCNFKNVTIENVRVDLEHHMPHDNQDGFHFWGPGQYLTMKNIQGRTGDDFIAVAPDEHDRKSSITDVLIDGVILHEADQGVRLLSRRDGLLDRVLVKNVTGTYKSFGFYVSAWFNENGGKYGSIIFEDINLKPLDANYIMLLDPFLFNVGGNFKQFVARNINMNECDNRNIFKIGYPFFERRNTDESEGRRAETSTMKSVLIEGLHVEEKEANALNLPLIKVTNPIESLIIRNCEFIRDSESNPGGTFLELDKEAKIGKLKMSGITLENVEKKTDILNGEIIISEIE